MPDRCPTCGDHWSGQRGLKNRRGRVRRRTRVPVEYTVLPGEWVDMNIVPFGEHHNPDYVPEIRRVWRKPRHIITRFESVSIRVHKFKVKPSHGISGQVTHSRIVCTDKWHKRPEPAPEAAERPQKYKSTTEHKAALKARSRARYLEKRFRNSKK